MKNSIKSIALVLLISLFSCSPDSSIDPTPPVVVIPTDPPVSSVMKPAIRNVNKSSSTSRVAAIKRVVKSIQYANSTPTTLYKYLLNNMTTSQYLDLPTDNIYDEAEIALNAKQVVI